MDKCLVSSKWYGLWCDVWHHSMTSWHHVTAHYNNEFWGERFVNAQAFSFLFCFYTCSGIKNMVLPIIWQHDVTVWPCIVMWRHMMAKGLGNVQRRRYVNAQQFWGQAGPDRTKLEANCASCQFLIFPNWPVIRCIVSSWWLRWLLVNTSLWG